MFESIATSSGYLVGDGSRVRTAYHNLDQATRYTDEAKFEPILKQSTVAFIYDAKGRLLWSPKDGETAARYSMQTKTANYTANQLIMPTNDLAEIRVGRPLGPPVKIAERAAKPNERMFMIGFPMATTDRKPFGAPDAPGDQLRISRGRVLTLEEVATRLETQPEKFNAYQRTELERLTLTDADGAPGLSGGATVNQAGELVGTYTAGNPQDGQAKPNRISFSSSDYDLSFEDQASKSNTMVDIIRNLKTEK